MVRLSLLLPLYLHINTIATAITITLNAPATTGTIMDAIELLVLQVGDGDA
jgi:hypothetical protein